MKSISIDEIRGGEISTEDVVIEEVTVLTAGSEIKQDYIDLLKGFNINYINIVDKYRDYENRNYIIDNQLESEFVLRVKDNLEKYIHNDISKIENIIKVSKEILDIIIENKDILINRIVDYDERTPDIYEHMVKVCELSVLLAIKMGLNESEVADIAVGSMIHDIGYRYLDMNLNNVSMEDMSPNEVFEYKKHTIYGYSSLEKMDSISEYSKMIVLSHHECLNGSGFPLKQKNISVGSQIVGICDTYDRMISGIACTREKIDNIRHYFENQTEGVYSREIVNTLLNTVSRYPCGSKIKFSDGQEGIVVNQTKDNDNPMVRRLIGDKMSETEEFLINEKTKEDCKKQ